MADKKSGWTPGWKTGGSSSSSTGSSGSGSSGNGSSAINGWTPGWKTESTNTSTSEVVDAITTDIKKPRRASNDIATPTYAQRIAADPTIKRLQEQKDTILSSKNPNDPLAKRGIAEIDRQIEEATKAASRSYAEKNESVPRNPITGNVQFLNPLVPFEDWGKQDIVPQSAMTPVANGWGTNPFTGEYDPSQYAGQYLPYNTEANNAQRAAEAVANPAAVESAAQREQAKAFVEAFADNGLHITGDTLDKLLTLQSQKKSILNSEGANDPRAQRGLAEIDRQMEAVLTPWLEENADAIADNYLGKMGVTIDGWDEASVILKKVLNFNDIDNQINDLSDKIAREVDPAKRAQLQADQDALLLQLDNARDNIEGGEDGGKEALKPVYESLNQVIEEMTNRYFNSADPTEKEQIYSALLLLNDRQAKLMSALGIEDRPFVNWEGRDELVSEYRRIRNTLNPTDQNGNKLTPEEALNYQLDIKNRLIEGDLLSGNGARSYSVGDWFANVINGTTENLASSLVSAPATTADFFIQNALGLTGKVTGKDYLNNNSGYDAIRNGIDAAYSISKELGDDAAESVERAKRGQNFAVRAGADILENGLQMGFDLGLAYVTGGSSLIPMGIRSFGGSAQEARDEGADINQQMAYGAVKAAIEVATEKMFDVAGFYGGGSMDDIVEGLVGKLAKTGTGRTALRLIMNASGEGIEEIVAEALDPFAKAIISDKSIRELYSDQTLEDYLYSAFIGFALGAFGGGVNVASGGNAAANYRLRLQDAGLGVNGQADSAWDVLTGRASAEEVNTRERAIRALMGLDENGNPVVRNNGPTPVVQNPGDNGQNGPTNPSNPTQQNGPTPSNPAPGNPTVNNPAPSNPAPSNPTVNNPSNPTVNNPSNPANGPTIINNPSNPSGPTVNNPNGPTNPNGPNNGPTNPNGPSQGSVEDEADGQLRERGESRNIRSDENMDEDLRKFKEQNPDMYRVLRNDKLIARAVNIFATQGLENSAATLEQALAEAKNGKKLPLEMVALHKLVCDELSKNGQVDRANRISADLGAELTYAGRLGQANIIFRNSSTTAKVDAFDKLVRRLVQENNANLSENDVNDLINRYRQAQDDAGRDAVLDDALTAIAQASPTTLREAFTALRYLNMLGNFKTQGRNIVGNTGMMVAAEAKDRILAIEQYVWNNFIDSLNLAMAGHDMTNNPFNLFGAELQRFAERGHVEQTNTVLTNPKLFGEAWKMYKEDQTEAMGEGKYSDVAQGNKTIRERKTIFKWNWKNEAQTKGGKALQTIADVPMNVLEFYRKATAWAMTEGDVIFQKVTYARTLADYARAQGYNSLSAVPEEELQKMREHAIKQAQEATFHDENAVSTWFSNFDKGFGKGKVFTQGIAPFRQTPANVGVRMEEYSPIGLVNTAVEFYRAIHDTGDFNAALNSASKSLTGTGLAALGFMLAKMGKARGKEDDEKLASYEKNVQGLGNYSLVLDDGTTISLDWLQPESAAFFVGVEAAELAEDGWQADDFMSLLGSTTDIALNMSFMSGANDFIGEIANSHGNQKAAPSLLLNAFLKYASQGLTNSLAGQAEQAFEKYRQTYYTDPNSPISTDVQKQLAKLSGKTPGIDYQQADYIDAWGRKQDNGPLAGRIAESFFSPAYINEDRSTPVDDELKRLHESVGEEIEGSVFPSIAQRSTEIGGVRLAPEEYDIYATTAGQRSLELVTDFINSPGYADLDDKTKAETIKKLYGYAKTDAKNAVLEARGEEPVTDKAYEKAKTIMNDAGLSWAEYFNVESGRDVNGDGNNSQEETVSYLLGSGLDDDKAEAVYNALYPTSQKPYSEIRDKVQGIEDAGFESLDAFNAIADAVAEARSAAKDEFDSAGNIEAAQLVKDADLTDEQKDMLIGKVSSKFVDFYNVARENGYGANDAIDLLLAIDATPGGKNDTPNNGSVSQGELKAYYKEHPEDEVIIALLWNSKNYSAGTWEEIKGKIK